MWLTCILHFAAGCIGWVCKFGHKQIGDLFHGLFAIQPQCLFISVSHMSGQIRQNDAPSLWIFPNKRIDTDVLTTLGDPYANNLHRIWV